MCIDLCRNIRLQLNTQMKQIIAGNWNQGLKIVDHFRLKLLINLKRERERLYHTHLFMIRLALPALRAEIAPRVVN